MRFLLALLSLLFWLPASAATLTIDPAKGETIGTAMRRIAAGDSVIVLPGNHGPVALTGRMAQRVTVNCRPGAVLGRMTVSNASGWLFRGCAFRGIADKPGNMMGLVQTDSASADVSFDRCSFASADDVSGWSDKDWVDRPYNLGLFLRGTAMNVSNSRFFNLKSALSASASNSFVSNNMFEEFSVDGIQVSANWLRITGNHVKGGRHTPAEPLHADGMQGYPAPSGGTWTNVSIEGNTVEFVGPGDYMQGISIFDGKWRNVRVVNNAVRVNAWNAIALFGIDNVLAEGNRIERPDGIKEVPYLQITKAKDGRPSTSVTVRANVAPRLLVDRPATVEGNKTVAGQALQ